MHNFFLDLQLGAMLEDRKVSARALFDANSQRQILTGVTVEVGRSVCHTLPFHVFVSPYNTDKQTVLVILGFHCFLTASLLVSLTGHSRLHPTNQFHPELQNQ